MIQDTILSQEKKTLSEYAPQLRAYNIESNKELEDFLNFIDCPEDLLRLDVVLTNIINALSAPLLKEIDNNPDLKRQAFFYKSIAASLKDSIEKNKEHLQLFASSEEAMHPEKALRGILNSNPRYTMLFIGGVTTKNSLSNFRQAIIFLEPLIKSSRNLEFKRSDYIKASLGFRHLMKAQPIQELLVSFLGHIESVQQLHVYLEALADEFKKHLGLEFNAEQLKLIRKNNEHPFHQQVLDYDNVKYVRRVIGLIRGVPIQRRNVTRRSLIAPIQRQKVTRPSLINVPFKTKKQRFADSLLLPLTFEGVDDEDAIIFGLVESPEKLDKEALESGEVPGEDDDGPLLLIDESVPLASYIQEFHRRRVSNDTIKRLERQNNYIPYSLQLLSPRELTSLIEFMGATSVSSEAQFLQVVLLCMFFTASSLERAVNLHVVELKGKNLKQLSSDVMYDISSHHWFIKSYDLGYKSVGQKYLDVYEPISYFCLPSTHFCKDVFERFWSNHRSRRLKITPYSADEVRSLFKKNFENIKDLKNGVLARVSNHLMILSCQVHGQATATLLFNRDPLGSGARSHYTTLSANVLEKRYKSLLKNISPIFNALLTKKYSAKLVPVSSLGVVGADWHPNHGYIIECIKLLKVRLITLSARWHKDESWVEFHNLYTIYVMYWTGMLTGLRPIKNPILLRQNLIKSAKVYIRREKSQSDEFNTRYIPLTDDVITQIEYYENHMLSVKGRLIRLGFDPKTLPPVFFLEYQKSHKEEKVKLLDFSVSYYRNVINKYCITPINSNRRFLRGFLEEPARLNVKMPPVPFEMIDTVIGHANIGEQFWSSGSTLGMRAIRKVVEPYLNELFKILKIKVLRGLDS